MAYGLEDPVVVQIKDVLKLFPSIEKVILYGSRAKGNYREGSDIDLCLIGDHIDRTLLNQVELALEDLDLPYSFDLSAYKNLTSVDLISHIDRRGIVFFERS